MYDAMKRAYLKVVPAKPPGLTLADIAKALLRTCRKRCFPAVPRPGGERKSPSGSIERPAATRATIAPLR